MKVAVMADIHSNSVALKSCIEYAKNEGVEAFLFLGDYIGELAYPQRTMWRLYELSREYPCYFIRGNKENYWLHYRAGWNVEWRFGSSTTGILRYDYDRLTERDLDFFASLPIARHVKWKGHEGITICHGSPDKINESLKPGSARIREILAQEESGVVLCAHTHVQFCEEYDGKLLINPGSVGVPLESNGMTQFAILTSEDGKWIPQLISLDYDVERAVAELYEEKLDKIAPGWTCVTERVLHGCDREHAHASSLTKVMELCREEQGECIWPGIPEEYWNRVLTTTAV